jgi:hypothetical protein
MCLRSTGFERRKVTKVSLPVTKVTPMGRFRLPARRLAAAMHAAPPR